MSQLCDRRWPWCGWRSSFSCVRSYRLIQIGHSNQNRTTCLWCSRIRWGETRSVSSDWLINWKPLATGHLRYDGWKNDYLTSDMLTWRGITNSLNGKGTMDIFCAMLEFREMLTCKTFQFLYSNTLGPTSCLKCPWVPQHKLPIFIKELHLGWSDQGCNPWGVEDSLAIPKVMVLGLKTFNLFHFRQLVAKTMVPSNIEV